MLCFINKGGNSMFKINDFVWVQNAVVMSFGVILKVPVEESGKYKVQLVHADCKGVIKGSVVEVFGNGLHEGVKHLRNKIEREEESLKNKKLLLKTAEERNTLEFIGENLTLFG